MQYSLTLILASLTVATGGCNLAAFAGYMLIPGPPKKTIKPEFAGLEKQHVAVAVYAGPETELDFQTIRLEISDAVAAELQKRIKGTTLVDARRVIRYQDENPGWNAKSPERLCTIFDCDYLLLVSLIEFSTHEMGSLRLVRGRLKAEARLYRSLASGEGGLAWRAKELFSVVHPPETPVGVLAQNDWDIRIQTEKLFAEALVKKFYKHKVPIEP